MPSLSDMSYSAENWNRKQILLGKRQRPFPSYFYDFVKIFWKNILILLSPPSFIFFISNISELGKIALKGVFHKKELFALFGLKEKM